VLSLIAASVIVIVSVMLRSLLENTNFQRHISAAITTQFGELCNCISVCVLLIVLNIMDTTDHDTLLLKLFGDGAPASNAFLCILSLVKTNFHRCRAKELKTRNLS